MTMATLSLTSTPPAGGRSVPGDASLREMVTEASGARRGRRRTRVDGGAEVYSRRGRQAW